MCLRTHSILFKVCFDGKINCFLPMWWLKNGNFHPCWYISWPLVGTRADNEGRPYWLLRRNRWTTVHKWLKYNAWPRVHCSLGSNSQELHPKHIAANSIHCMPMSISKSCCHVLQSQAERSRVSRQISLTPDTYSSISTHKYSTKVSQTTLAHPHKPTLLHTHSIKHICWFVTDYAILSLLMVDLLGEIFGAFTFAKEAAFVPPVLPAEVWFAAVVFSVFSGWWWDFYFLLFPLTCFSLALCFLVQPHSHTSSLSPLTS